MTRHEKRTILAIMFTVVVWIIGMTVYDHQMEIRECTSRGGHWLQVGERTLYTGRGIITVPIETCVR